MPIQCGLVKFQFKLFGPLLPQDVPFGLNAFYPAESSPNSTVIPHIRQDPHKPY